MEARRKIDFIILVPSTRDEFLPDKFVECIGYLQ